MRLRGRCKIDLSQTLACPIRDRVTAARGRDMAEEAINVVQVQWMNDNAFSKC